MSIRTPVNLADLAQAFAELQPKDPETRLWIASLLGFAAARPLAPEVSTPSAEFSSPRPRETLPPQASETPADETPLSLDEPEPAISEPEQEDVGAQPLLTFELEGPEQGSPPGSAEERPEWWNRVTVLGSHLTPARIPQPDPLLLPIWARTTCMQILSTAVLDGPLDVPQLVDRLARLESPTEIPRLPWSTLRRGVQVLIDSGDAMMPFREDQRRLLRELRELAGSSAFFEVFLFRGTPVQWARPLVTRRTIQGYELPPPGTPLLALTDLGIGALAAGQPYLPPQEWLTFHRQTQSAGSRLTVLLPYSPERCPPSLRGELEIVHWHHRRGASGSAATALEEGSEEVQDLLDDLRRRNPQAVALAHLASLASRVEASLLRELRLTLLPDADGGAEADLWFSPLASLRNETALLLQPEVGTVLRRRLCQADPQRFEAAWQIVKAFRERTGAFEGASLEEEINYWLAQGEGQAEVKVQELLRIAVKTVYERGVEDDEGLALWSVELLDSLPPAARESEAGGDLGVAAGFRLHPSYVQQSVLPDSIGSRQWLIPVDTANLPPTSLWVGREPEGLVLGDRAELIPGGKRLDGIPATTPLVLWLSWEGGHHQVSIIPGQKFGPIDTGGHPVTIESCTGLTWTLTPTTVETISEAIHPRGEESSVLDADPWYELEIQLRRHSSAYGSYTLTLNTTYLYDGRTTSETVGEVQLGTEGPSALVVDPLPYGQWLAAAIFGASPRVAGIYHQLREQAGYTASPLRIRLDLDPDDRVLHNLYWELLCDPEQPLALDPRTYFARRVAAPPAYTESPLKAPWIASSEAYESMEAPAYPESQPTTPLRALVVAPALPYLSNYQTPPDDVESKIARAHSVLGEIPRTVLAGPGAATLAALVDQLHQGYNILYLTAPVAGSEGMLSLILEDEKGEPFYIPMIELASVLASLPAQPFVIFADAAEDHWVSGTVPPGPLLLEHGVPAVLSWQAPMPAESASAFLTVFLRELGRDNRVERAMALARQAIREDRNWWAPMIYTAVPDGRLFLPAGEQDSGSEFGSERVVERWLHVEFPTPFILGEEARVAMRLLLEPHSDNDRAIDMVFQNEHETAEVEVILHAPGFREQNGVWIRTLDVSFTEDSAAAEFNLSAEETGETMLGVDLGQQGRIISSSRLAVLVQTRQMEIVRRVAANAKLTRPLSPNPDLELQITRLDERRLGFTLHSTRPDLGYHWREMGSVELDQVNFKASVDRIYDRLNQLARGPFDKQDEKERAISIGEIEDVGIELYSQSLPPDLQQEMSRILAVGQAIREQENRLMSLLITSDEPWIPWELVRPPGSEDFLASAFQLSRWLPGLPMKHQLTIEAAALLAPELDLGFVEDQEVPFFRELDAQGLMTATRIRTLQEFWEVANQGGIQLIHAATHGRFDGDYPDESPIRLAGGDLVPRHINSYRAAGIRQEQPLVFFNSVDSGRMQLNAGGFAGWAQRMLMEVNATAFIGSLYEVTDELAALFSRTFYTALVEGTTLGAAFHAARMALREWAPANPTWLAYTLYGNPHARIMLGGARTAPMTKASRATVSLPPKFQPSSGPDLELRVRQLGERSLGFTLHSTHPELGYHWRDMGRVELRGQDALREWQQSVYANLSRARSRTGDQQASAKEIERLGMDLYNSLIPEPLRQEMPRLLAAGRTIQERENRSMSLLITSDEPWVPWEMVRPYDLETDEADDFLAGRWQICRWLAGPGQTDRVQVMAARLIASDLDLKFVEQEKLSFDEMKGWGVDIGPRPLQRLEEVQALLEEGGVELLHFATHGNFDSEHPDEAGIYLADRALLSTRDLRGSRVRGLRQARPIIFLNACHTAQMGFTLTGLGSWVERMLIDVRASAFIGTLWEVNDELAAEFSHRFYQALWQKATLGEAFYTARQHVRNLQPANSTWLAYTLYGHPNTRINFGSTPRETDNLVLVQRLTAEAENRIQSPDHDVAVVGALLAIEALKRAPASLETQRTWAKVQQRFPPMRSSLAYETAKRLSNNLRASLAVSANGERVAVVTSQQVRVWEISTGEMLFELQPPDSDVSAIALEANGALLATSGFKGLITLWDVTSGRVVAELMGNGPAQALGFSADSQRLAAGMFDEFVQVWDIKGRVLVANLDHVTGDVLDVALNEDGSWLTTTCWHRQIEENVARVWATIPRGGDGGYVGAGRYIKGDIRAIAINAYGDILATGGFDKEVEVWALQRASDKGDMLPVLIQKLVTLPVNTGVAGLAVSRDGKHVAVATADRVALWEVEQQKIVGSVPHAEAKIVAFVDHDRQLVTVSDTLAHVWDIAYGKGMENQLQRSVQPLADPEVTLQQIPEVCRRIGRNLTQEEWKRYLGPDESYRQTCPDLPGASSAAGGTTQSQPM
jgi:CHAT domain-containing protein/WD40 repeat protein